MILKPHVRTPCGYIVPYDRICFGNHQAHNKTEPEECLTCPVYSENQKSQDLGGLGRVSRLKKVNHFSHGKLKITQSACAVSVEVAA